MMTYGDGVADVEILKLLETHQLGSNMVTLTAVQPPARFGALVLDGQNNVTLFQEKPTGDGAWINGGFFVIEPEVFSLIRGRNCSFESIILPEISEKGALGAFKHQGFWQPVDTIRDLQRLEEAIADGKLPWV